MKEKIIRKIENKTASKCKRVTSLKPTTSAITALKELMAYSDIPQTTAPRESRQERRRNFRR